ncbi:MAG TPA: hypothetical protein VEJ46_08695 [Candidatus Acidoferrum sp.]|nr:hypothetical protein [Candidatus Acidoferrum sp.]
MRKKVLPKNIIAKRVAEARRNCKPALTQDALSGKLARLGIQLDRAAIAKIENNLRRVLDYELKALADALGVNVNWLLGDEKKVKDPTSQLRSATRRAKSDVANKLVSMFLHELSRRISRGWRIKVDSEEYEELVRTRFNNRCPYCSRELANRTSVIEHLDGLNRYRTGLHVPGNVLVACRDCNIEKRRDDSLRSLSLAASGWESFLSHDCTRCADTCLTCGYWSRVWGNAVERRERLKENLERIRSFRHEFPDFEDLLPSLTQRLPGLLTKLYSDCQTFAETEIRSLLERFEEGHIVQP